MIKVVKKDNIITISGHANSAEYGKDIVCASVSSILITSVNAMLRIDEDSINYNDNDGVSIDILKHTEVIDKLLVNLEELLIDLQKQYPKYIEIRRC